MAVVDDQRGAAVSRPRRATCGRVLRSDRHSNTSPSTGAVAASGSAGSFVSGCGDSREGEFAAGIRPPIRRSCQPSCMPLGLMDRQGIEELVGEDDGRSRRRLVRAYPCQRSGTSPTPREGLALVQLQRRARLDEMHPHRLAECRERPRGAQHVAPSWCRGRARARSACTGSGAPIACHTVGRPQPDQFAEHLADLRGGDEIAGARRTACAASNNHARGRRGRSSMKSRPGIGPVARDPAADFGRPAGCAPRSWAAVMDAPAGAAAQRPISPTPAMNSGTHSSMPMVSWPHRKPSCGSGSRKNSQNERITA